MRAHVPTAGGDAVALAALLDAFELGPQVSVMMASLTTPYSLHAVY